MITYLIRQDSTTRFTVSKWEMSVEPIAVYVVDLSSKGRAKCNCPSGYNRGYCHHTDMVKKWIDRGTQFGEIVC